MDITILNVPPSVPTITIAIGKPGALTHAQQDRCCRLVRRLEAIRNAVCTIAGR